MIDSHITDALTPTGPTLLVQPGPTTGPQVLLLSIKSEQLKMTTTVHVHELLRALRVAGALPEDPATDGTISTPTVTLESALLDTKDVALAEASRESRSDGPAGETVQLVDPDLMWAAASIGSTVPDYPGYACHRRSQQGYGCGRMGGHPGQHVAVVLDGDNEVEDQQRVVATWDFPR